ncbi:MAG: hypothetical protein GY903_05870 [Fuerstiella sp.]|nr:hypothetical protein [Fuerstiella sp.]MCP4854001.1 hypothetical protein [Fuerstiella sp.]
MAVHKTRSRPRTGGHIIVHVWDAKWLKGSPGHAAIHIGTEYVSFWPGSEQGTLAWKGYRTKSYTEDIKTYQATNQCHWAAIIPSNDGKQKGLDKANMLKKWTHDIKVQNKHYAQVDRHHFEQFNKGVAHQVAQNVREPGRMKKNTEEGETEKADDFPASSALCASVPTNQTTRPGLEATFGVVCSRRVSVVSADWLMTC